MVSWSFVPGRRGGYWYGIRRPSRRSSGRADGCRTLTISLSSGRWFVAGIATMSIVMQLLYNLEPVRLKRRGFAGAGVFGLSMATLPCLLSYSAVRSGFEPAVWPIFASLGVMAIGRTAWWSVPDRIAAVATGMATPTVRYGAARALVLSCVVMGAGLGLLGWGLWWRYGPAWVPLGVVNVLRLPGRRACTATPYSRPRPA
jgi:4-hydroxybenzoate polyprenyltransferase